jgi:arylsulfatase A-like enzyme
MTTDRRATSGTFRTRGVPLAMFCLAAFAAAAGAAEPAAQQAAPGKLKPNIIFILADDLGYGDLGCFGQQRIRTPYLDRMAAEGVRFTQFYAGCTVCAPSRGVLMTGLHTGHARVRGNADVPLAPQDVTVAEVLHGAGYRSALVGKWGLGEIGSTGEPTRQGFDYFFGYVNQVHAHNYYPAFLWRNEERVALRNEVPPGKHPAAEKVGGGVATKKVDYAPDLFTAEALKWVEQNKAGPFFLYLAYTTPHANDEAAPRGMEVPDQGEYAREKWPEVEKDKAAMVTRMDRDIGSLLDLLKRLSIDDNTIVFFTSDNGPHKEGGVDPKFFNSGGPLRGIKRDLYEGGIREPTIVRWPGHTKPGTTSDFAGTFQDFLATAADLAGAQAPKTDGVSFLPSILGKPDEQKQHDYLYWEFYEGGGAQAVRFGDWKAVRKPLEAKKVELYDLKADLGEKHDIAPDHPDLVQKAESIMRQAHTPSEHWKLPSEGGTTKPTARGRARP